jgi:hypothetical protein
MFACAASMVFAVFPPRSTANARNADPAHPATIRLIIDYGEGVEKHFNALPFTEGMSVASAMAAAKSLSAPRGLVYESKGEGERTILLSIDGLANEGAGKGSRNWLFWVNDQPGQTSYAISPLKAGDVAAWRFATYDALKKKP